jgi:hypothetical protein
MLLTKEVSAHLVTMPNNCYTSPLWLFADDNLKSSSKFERISV